jgi:hypothetical protein
MTACTQNPIQGKVQGISPTGTVPIPIPAAATVEPAPTESVENTRLRTGQTPARSTDRPEPGRFRPAGRRMYLRGSSSVFEAMEILTGWHFSPARIQNAPIPVDIIAFRKSQAFLVQVIPSHTPVPDAKTLARHYKETIDDLRRMGSDAQFRKIVMVCSSPTGWKYYEVLPGGLIPAWDLPEAPEG